MKRHYKIALQWCVGLLAGLSVSSCDLQEANINPNAVTDAPINVVLPAAQANMTWAIGDFSSQSASTLVQYMTGLLNVQQNVTFFAYVPANFQTSWNNHYYRSLQGLKKVIEDGEAAGARHYSGIGKIQTALVLGHLVDLFGDVPFSEALNPEEFPTPRFDSSEFLYDEIFRLLDEAIADLNAESTVSPATDDLVYPANNANNWRANSRPNWIKAAHALKARYANHLSKVDPQGSAQAALAAIQAGAIDSNAANMNAVFGNSPDAAGPWFGFLQGTFGQNNIAVCNTFVNKLLNRVGDGQNDPRLPFFIRANSAGQFVGADYGATSLPPNVSVVGEYMFSPSSPTNFITFAEVKFIEAEAQQRLGNFSAAAEALNAAITASMQRVTGSTQPAYLAVYGASAADMADNGMERIFTEKHIDMFLQTESWVDWRRSIPAGAAPTVSGIPALSPAPGNLTDNAFPRRYLYPPSELDNNAANIPETSLLARVFWDR